MIHSPTHITLTLTLILIAHCRCASPSSPSQPLSCRLPVSMVTRCNVSPVSLSPWCSSLAPVTLQRGPLSRKWQADPEGSFSLTLSLSLSFRHVHTHHCQCTTYFAKFGSITVQQFDILNKVVKATNSVFFFLLVKDQPRSWSLIFILSLHCVSGERQVAPCN